MYHETFRMALDVAVNWSWVPVNPLRKVEAPVYRSPDVELLSDEDLQKIIRGAKRWKRLWLFQALIGCRISELRGLVWSDIDFDSGTIRITQQAFKNTRVSLKTLASKRILLLSSDALDLLQSWKMSQDLELLKCGVSNSEGWIWTNREGTLVALDALLHAFRRDANRADLKNASSHSLRHWNASMLIGAGVPIPEVAQRLGHTSPVITLKLYAHARLGQEKSRDATSHAFQNMLGDSPMW